MLTLLSGLAAGAAHVVSGPDHLAALAPIAIDHPGRAAAIGGRWGLGHGAGVAVIGGLGVWARDLIDTEALSAWAEYSVGFLLIALGAWALWKASRMVIHDHGHDHVHRHAADESGCHEHDLGTPHALDDAATSSEGASGAHSHHHAHLHVHASASDHDAADAHSRHGRTAFLVGLVHGAAGAGHLFGVLPSLLLPKDEAVIYLVAYVVAAVAAMAGFGGILGVLARRGSPTAVRTLMIVSACTAIVVGGMWLVTAQPA